MAKAVLPTNFQDDILNASMDGKRRYNQVQNTDGTVSLEDASVYDQVGSNFGAGQINATNKAVNESVDKAKIIKELDDIAAVTQAGYIPDALAVKQLNNSLGGIKFAKDSSGNWGYYEAGADSVTPFKGNIAIIKNKPTYPGWTYTIEQSGYFMYLSSINISSPIFKKSFTLNGVEIKCNNSYDKPLNNDTWILGFNEPIKVKKGDVITFVPALTTAYPGILLMC